MIHLLRLHHIRVIHHHCLRKGCNGIKIFGGTVTAVIPVTPPLEAKWCRKLEREWLLCGWDEALRHMVATQSSHNDICVPRFIWTTNSVVIFGIYLTTFSFLHFCSSTWSLHGSSFFLSNFPTHCPSSPSFVSPPASLLFLPLFFSVRFLLFQFIPPNLISQLLPLH